MSSNHLLPTLPVSQSADDLTQSQLEEAYSSEDDIEEEKIPSVKEELERIAVAIETACNQQQKLGENMISEVRSITEHVKNAVIIEASRQERTVRNAIEKDWIGMLLLVGYGLLTGLTIGIFYSKK